MKPWPVVTTILIGCASAAPPPHEIDVVARCSEVLELADNLFYTDRYPFIAEHCVAPMVREPACREALMRSLEVDASTRNRTVAPACRRAYCPRMQEPKAAICDAELDGLSPSEMLPLGMELFARVREVELGQDGARRWDEAIGGTTPQPTVSAATPPPAPVTAPREVAPPPAKVVKAPPPAPPAKVVKAPPPAPPPPPKVVKAPPPPHPPAPPPPPPPPPPPKVVKAPPPPPPPPPPPKVVKAPPPPAAPPKEVKPAPSVSSTGAVTLRLLARPGRLIVALGDETWDLPDKPAGSAFGPAAERAVEIARGVRQVKIELGPEIHYHHVVGMLNALRARHVQDIAITSVKP